MIKHITKKLLTSILVGTTLVIPITTFGFGTDTHKVITEIACNNLSSYIEKNDRKLIIDNSVWPDYYENDMEILQPYRSHFYNEYEDGKNGQNNKRNAKKQMFKHLESARIAHLQHNKRQSMEYLGRALHYFQDICCPVHVWGYEYNLGNLTFHSSIEKYWDTNINSIIKFQPLSGDKLCLRNFYNYSHEELFNQAYNKTTNYVNIFEDIAKFNNTRNMQATDVIIEDILNDVCRYSFDFIKIFLDQQNNF